MKEKVIYETFMFNRWIKVNRWCAVLRMRKRKEPR